MENKKEKTAPNVSVGADTEQPIQKIAENSISEYEKNIKSFEEMQREMQLSLDPSYLKAVSMNEMCIRDRYHADVTYFRYQWNSTGCTWICFQYIYFSVFNCILHVHKTSDMHFFCNFSCIFLDCLYIFFGNVRRRDVYKRQEQTACKDIRELCGGC